MIHPRVLRLKEKNSHFSASTCSFYVVEIIVIIVILRVDYFKIQLLFDSLAFTLSAKGSWCMSSTLS